MEHPFDYCQTERSLTGREASIGAMRLQTLPLSAFVANSCSIATRRPTRRSCWSRREALERFITPSEEATVRDDFVAAVDRVTLSSHRGVQSYRAPG